MTLVAVTALALGAWSPAARPSPAVVVAADAVAGPAAGFTAPAAVDTGRLAVGLPRGYDTQARRAERAAVEAEAAAAVRAAAEAQAAAARAAGAASTAAAPAAGRSSGRTAAPSPAASSAPTGAALPLGVDPGGSRQVVTVVAPSSRSTSAQLTAWELGPAGWTPVLGPVTARIGSSGVGAASETSTRTPAGTYTLTEAFGRAGNPGTALPYRVVDGDDWWVSDVQSPRYNQYAECARGTCDFAEAASENLADELAYAHAVVIDYNGAGTPGAGSAFFLHLSNGAPTAGCVAVDAGSLTALLRWLDPAARPLIAIGVG
ncbi:L,D-transpeptidase family protein [Blastococcus sp. SYSU DS0619]